MNEVLSIALAAAAVNHLVLDRHLAPAVDPRGIVGALAVGTATAATTVAAVAATYTLARFVLEPFGAQRFELLVLLLASVAAAAAATALLPARFAALRRALLKRHLGLIAGSAALIGSVVQRAAAGGFVVHVAASLAGAIAFVATLALLAGLRQRLDRADVAAPFRGAAIVLVTAAFIALAFSGITGTAPP